MVSRRNFFTITLIMLVVFFMFQIPEVAKDRWNYYDVNKYEEQTKTELDQRSVYRARTVDADLNGRYIVYIGYRSDGGVGNVVKQWCLYTKRYLEVFRSVKFYQPDENRLPEALLIDSSYFDVDTEMDKLMEFVDLGISLVFCNLPAPEVIDGNNKLKRLLGIHTVMSKSAKTEGIRLMDGFLLGGQKEYKLEEGVDEKRQDFLLEMPWYWVSSGTRTYMAARMEAELNGLKNEALPAIIWRNGAGNAQVFAVNGDYLSDNTGIGILEAMMAELKDYDIYPVVNAKNLVVVNFPILASENEAEMMKRYSQPLKAVCRDVVWPGLIAVAQKNSMKMTCMIAPQTNYVDSEEPEEELLVYYMKLIREQSAEAGASGSYREDVDLRQKLLSDTSFYQDVIENYALLSLYQGNLSEGELTGALSSDAFSDVRAVCTDFEEHKDLFSYFDSNVLMQSSINNGFTHTFREDFRLNSVASALGYSGILLDGDTVAWPRGKEETWEKLSEKFASYTNTYWNVCDKFDGTTLAESDARVRRFLALNYSQKREADNIRLNISNFDKEAWFILRTHGEEITEAWGATFEKLEEDAYLIGATESEVVLKMEKTSRIRFD